MTGLKTVVLAAAAALCLCASALGQDYEIKMSRPVTVGQEYQVSATGREVQKATVTVNGQVVKNENQESSIEVEMAVKVLEIDKNGASSKASLAIVKCLEVKGETKTPLVPAGAVVVASLKDKEPVYEIAGQKVSPEAQQALSQVYTPGKGGATDDQIMGTTERKKIGDRWALNSEFAAKDAAANGLDVKPEDIKGTVTLEKIVKAGGTDCLQLAAEVNIARFVPPAPPGLVVEKGKMLAKMSGLFPVNASLGEVEKSETITISIVMKGAKPQPDAPELVVDTVGERQTTVRYPRTLPRSSWRTKKWTFSPLAMRASTADLAAAAQLWSDVPTTSSIFSMANPFRPAITP
ncbi:MAG: hypothetical protein NT049_05920 [Planctomycetota bacterium]|nr:hypothetical protein [Planctomycetota bacterium]